MIAIVFAILAIVCFLVAALGGAIGIDLTLLGLTFLSCAVLAMNLPATWPRRVP